MKGGFFVIVAGCRPFLDIIIKIIEISPQEFWKNLEHKYQYKFSKALSEYIMSHAFSKVLLQVLNMFLLNRALFLVKNLLWGIMEILFTESLVLDHNFQEIRCVCFTHGRTCFYPISEGKTNA